MHLENEDDEVRTTGKRDEAKAPLHSTLYVRPVYRLYWLHTSFEGKVERESRFQPVTCKNQMKLKKPSTPCDVIKLHNGTPHTLEPTFEKHGEQELNILVQEN